MRLTSLDDRRRTWRIFALLGAFSVLCLAAPFMLAGCTTDTFKSHMLP